MPVYSQDWNSLWNHGSSKNFGWKRCHPIRYDQSFHSKTIRVKGSRSRPNRGERHYYINIKQSGTFCHCIRENGRKRMTEEEREPEAGARDAIFFYNPKLLICLRLYLSVLRQNGADHCLSVLPCVGSTAFLGFPLCFLSLTVLKISHSPSHLLLPLPLSCIPPTHARTYTHSHKCTHTLTVTLI